MTLVDRSQEQTAMAVFAHPDDAELSCFGLLSKLRRQGRRIVLVVVTRGENGADCAAWNRVEEATMAARRIGAEVVFGDFRDGYVTSSAELVGWIEQLLSEYRPSMVISHFAGDTSTAHQDHVAVAAAVRIAKCGSSPAEIDVLVVGDGCAEIAAQAAQSEVTARIRMRFRPWMTSQDRVIHGGTTYGIESVIDVRSEHRELVLMCKALG